MTYFVHIKKIATDEIVKTINCGSSESLQSRTMFGAGINLNHSDYYVDSEDKAA